MRHVHETGVSAIPIVSLIAFLISVVVAYLGAQQLAQFGATIFVVDLVTIAVLREMGVLLTAIIVAGRSGSAFAAEIGVMQLNEEIDALRAMGMNPIELLVVPRVLGLVIALPCLTVIADAMGLAGGGLLSLVQLHIPPAQFTTRLREALSSHDILGGPGQGTGVRAAHRHGRGVPRHAGARLGARARAPDDHGRRAVHLSGDSRGRAFRHPVRANRFLMAPDTQRRAPTAERSAGRAGAGPREPLRYAGRARRPVVRGAGQ